MKSMPKDTEYEKSSFNMVLLGKSHDITMYGRRTREWESAAENELGVYDLHWHWRLCELRLHFDSIHIAAQ